MTDLTALAKAAEAYETPRWAAEAILDVEILTKDVVDPCTGYGVLRDVAKAAGYRTAAFDKYSWGANNVFIADFLTDPRVLPLLGGNTVFMNPPFSLAEQFVERCFKGDARKIVCFQRHSWWESKGRREFWERRPPNRKYICGDRASCWRFDIPEDEQGNRIDPVTGKKLAGTTTAHAWFIWERGHPIGSLAGHIYKESNP